MKFLFLSKGNEKLGSNRIYINNLSEWIADLGHQVKISNKIIEDYDVYILSKYSTSEDITSVRKLNNKSLIGIIHPSDSNLKTLAKIKTSDFFITGSIEEQDYYTQYNKNVFLVPQIEKIQVKKKYHREKNKIKIGYHGNLEHLEEMEGACANALERLSNKYNLDLITIYDQSLGRWKKGRPNNINIIEYNWSTIDDLILNLDDVDIGIVPCNNNFFLDHKNKETNLFSHLIRKFTGGSNKRQNDYIIRFKNTSNAGRAYVFHQLGIPIVAGFWPSNFHIIDNRKYGFLAHSEEGWYNSLEKLITSFELRQNFADNVKRDFALKFDTIDITKNLISDIQKLLK